MEIDTVFGVKWPVASNEDYAVIAILLILLVAVFALIRYRIFLEDKKIHDYQLFLFKMKRLGLSNFQIKILNNMTEILRLANPNQLLEDSAHFEDAIGKFLLFLQGKNESEETLASICKDITIIYEKVYHNQPYKKPLERIHDIEINQLLYFVTPDGGVYLGKIMNKKSSTLSVALFRSAREVQQLKEPVNIEVFIWRVGDAEYKFKTATIGMVNNLVQITIPEEFIRDKEFRHPYLDVIIPAITIKADLKPLEEPERISGTILKINDYELVMRMNRKMDYRFRYMLEFEIMDFKFNVASTLIAGKTIEEGNVIYYTFKFDDMSEGAKNVLKKFIYEHL